MKSKKLSVQWYGENLPDSWKIVSARTAFTEKTERSGESASDYLSLTANAGVIPYADKGDIGNKAPEDMSKCKRVSAGNFVLNSMNFGIGSFGVSKYEGVCSSVYLVLEPKNDQFNPTYLKRIFELASFQRYAQSLGNGILAHRAAFGWDKLRAIPLPLPPREVQDAIVEFLDQELAAADILLEKYKKLIKVALSLRKSLIHSACTKGLKKDLSLVATNLNWLGEIPEHWAATPLKWVTKLQSGSTPEGAEFSETRGKPWLRPDDLNDRGMPSKSSRFFDESVLRDNEARAGSTLVCAIGATLGKTGWIESPAYFNQQITSTTSISKSLTDRFLYWSLVSAIDGMKEISVGNTLPILNNDKHGTLKIAVPPLTEQTEISEYLDRETLKIDRLIDLSNLALKVMDERRSALITASVTGKLDIRSV